MPQAVPYLIAAGKAIYAAATTAAAWFNSLPYLAQVGIQIGVSVGLSLLTRPNIPDPESGKITFRQAIPPRQFGYGMTRISGPQMLFEPFKNSLHRVVAVMDGPVGPNAFKQWYLNDDKVTLVGGVVQELADDSYNGNAVTIQTRRGSVPGIPYADLTAAVPTLWPITARGDNMTSFWIKETHGKLANYPKQFPNGSTQPSVVMELGLVWDWRDPAQDPDDPSTWLVSFNPIVNLRDYLCDATHGMGFDHERRIAPNLAILTAAADACDVAVPLKAGGTEPKYQCGGFFNYQTNHSDVINALTQTCDGWLSHDGRGAFVVYAGILSEATIRFGDAEIIGYEAQPFEEDEYAINSIVPSFCSPDHDYTMVEAEAWNDEADIADRGQLRPSPLKLSWVQWFSQTRRLAKRGILKGRGVKGSTVLNMAGLAVLGERYIIIDVPYIEWLQELLVEVRSVSIQLESGTVTVQWVAIPPFIDEWDASTEEGTPPPVEGRSPLVGIDTPNVVSVSVEYALGGAQATFVITDPGRADYGYVLRWRDQASANPSYVVEYPESAAGAAPGTVEITSSVLPLGATIEYGVAFLTSANVTGPFTALDDFITDSPADPVEDALDDLLSAMTVQPNATRKNLMRTYIRALMEDLIWPKIDYLLIMAGHDAQAVRVDWKHQRIAIVHGAPVFTTDRDYTFNGSSDYLDTTFVPNSHAVALTAISQGIAVYERTNLASAGYTAGTFQSTTRNMALIPRSATDTRFGYLSNSSASSAQAGATDSRGMTAFSRSGAVFSYYQNGLLTGTVAPTGGPNLTSTYPVFIGALNNAGVAANFRATHASVIALTASLNATEELAFFQATEAYLDGVGAGVIP